MLCYYSRIFIINAYKRGQDCNTKFIFLFRHFYPKIRSLTCCALLACRGVWSAETKLWVTCLSRRMTSLKIPNWYSESVNRRTDNTTAKKKWTNGQTTDWLLSADQVESWSLILAWFYHPPRENRLCKYAVINIFKCCLSAILIEYRICVIIPFGSYYKFLHRGLLLTSNYWINGS